MANKMSKMVSAIKADGLRLVKDKHNQYYGVFEENESQQVYPIDSPDFENAVIKMVYRRFGIILHNADYQTFVRILQFDTKAQEVEVAVRVYRDDEIYLYELDKAGNCVCITDETIEITKVDGVIFRHAIDYAANVCPDLDVRPEDLLGYVRRHFNVASQDEVRLLAVYLVSCFWGMDIAHPILCITGEKGSAKSTSLRKLERLIDPKVSDLGGIPKGEDGLALRLANVYFTALDNLSSLSRSTSDLLARSCTGGTVSKRKLYSNTGEIVLNIKSLVALNGVSMVARESDLLDRALVINLQRIPAQEMRTETEIYKSFERDRPKMLGCCFLALLKAMNDKEPIKTSELIRLGDFQVACIRIGRALKIQEEEVTRILWNNYRNVNNQVLDEDVVATCIIELMGQQKKFRGSVTDLMLEIAYIAETNGISNRLLPKAPNILSRRLNKVKCNLESVGIFYTIKNIGAFKQIEIEKKE